MNTGTLSSSQLHALLSTQVSTVRDEDRLTLIGIVRSGSVRDTIEIALNNTGKWVAALSDAEIARRLKRRFGDGL